MVIAVVTTFKLYEIRKKQYNGEQNTETLARIGAG